MNWVTSDQTKHHDVDWVFAFHHYRYILWGLSKAMVVLRFHHLILTEIFLIEENQNMFDYRGCLSLFKSFTGCYFLCPSCLVIKKCPFLILYEKYWISSCTTCLIRKFDTPNLDLTCRYRCQLRLASHQQIREIFSYQNEQVNFRNQHWTEPLLFEFSALSSN